MNALTSSASQKRQRSVNRMKGIFWIVISAFIGIVFTNVAQAAAVNGTATSTQAAMMSMRNQNPDGWIPCASFNDNSKTNGRPRNKSAYHDVTFNNCKGSYDLDVTRIGDKCMYGAGNKEFKVPVGMAFQINLEDKNSGGCYDRDKTVDWSIRAEGGPLTQAEWIHSDIANAAWNPDWETEISASDIVGAGKVNNATCDGNLCLNKFAKADTGRPQDIIYFD